mgnify:CR=1 FL=1
MAARQNILITGSWYLYYDGGQYNLLYGYDPYGSARTIQSALNLYLDQRAINDYVGGTSNVSFATALARRNGYAESLASSDALERITVSYQPVQWGEGL